MKTRLIISSITIAGIIALAGCNKTTEPQEELYTEAFAVTQIEETTEAAIPFITDTAEMDAVLGSLTEEQTSTYIYGNGADVSEVIFTVFTYEDTEYGAVVINNAFGAGDVKELKIAGTFIEEDRTDPNSKLTTKTYTISDIYTGEKITVSTVSRPDDITGNLEVSGSDIHYKIEYRKLPVKNDLDFLHNLVNGQRNMK